LKFLCKKRAKKGVFHFILVVEDINSHSVIQLVSDNSSNYLAERTNLWKSIQISSELVLELIVST